MRTLWTICVAGAKAIGVGLLLVCATAGGFQLTNDLVQTDASGRALDWAGMLLRCSRSRTEGCMGYLKWDKDYNYKCDMCGRMTTARRCGTQVEFGGEY